MYRLSDELIGQIARLLQLALLDGTDIVDHMRSIHVKPDDQGFLVPTTEYTELFESHLKMMEETAQNLQAQNLDKIPDA